MKNKEIGVLALLKRVSYPRYKKSDDFFLAFDQLDEVDTEIDIDTEINIQMMDNDSNPAGTNTNQLAGEPANSNLCGTCITNVRDYLLDPCGHVYFCMECWEKHRKYDPTTFDITDEDGNILDVINVDEPLQPVRCPYCKEEVQKGIKIRTT